MAIYHMSVQMISRGSGRSAIAAAAYRSGERIHDQRQGLTHDYSSKEGVEYSEILAPNNAPDWVYDRAKLWNEVDKSETRINSQTAREIQLALPKEISNQSQEKMLREYAKQNFVSKGMIADISIHRDNPENPHSHIMLTTREIGPDGFGKKARDWNDRNLYRHFREEWARQANLSLAREGIDQRVDHRSYADQGIDLEPTKHLGFRADQVENDKRDLTTEKWVEHQEIIRRNAEAIRERPEIVLEAITHQKSTFTRSDVGRFLNTRTVDADQFRDCLEKVMSSEELVKVGRDQHGRDRYTTKEMLELEKSLVENSKTMHETEKHSVNLKYVLEAEKSRTLSSEQVLALHHITLESGDVSVIEGYAGAGKSYMLGAAREAWEKQGYRVLGGALAGKAAEGLQESAQIESRSLHAWEYAWKKGTEKLTRRDVLVIDEAGMVGSRQMSRVFETARRSGTKIVLVGDLEQLQAIEAGAPMRAVAEVAGSLTMDDIRRQSQDWQREATQKLATGRTKEAIQDYESRNFVHEHETKAQAMTSMVQAWNENRKSNPGQTQIMLAFRRDEVRSLNEQARTLCQQDGKLGRDFLVKTELGQREFAQGDRVYFLKNDFLLGVKNGTLGTIERMDKQSMQVRVDGKDGRRVNVDLSGYNHLDHGYAATVHKSQGVTVDRAHALAGSHYDRHVTYVAMSRHRTQVDLHWSREESKDRAQLLETLSRARLKDLAVDYQKVIKDNHELARQVKSQIQMEGVEHGRSVDGDLGQEHHAVGEDGRGRGLGDDSRAGFQSEGRPSGPEPGEREGLQADPARNEQAGEQSRRQERDQRAGTKLGRDQEPAVSAASVDRGAESGRAKQKTREEKRPLDDRVLGVHSSGDRRDDQLGPSSEMGAERSGSDREGVGRGEARRQDDRTVLLGNVDGSESRESTRTKELAPGAEQEHQKGREIQDADRGDDRTYRREAQKTTSITDEEIKKLAQKIEERVKFEQLAKQIKKQAEQDAEKLRQKKVEKEVQRKREDLERNPEKVIQRHDELARIASRDPKDPHKVHEQQPEIRAAQEKLARAEREHKNAKRQREDFEKEHPWKARLGAREYTERLEKENQAKKAEKQAKEQLIKTWDDPVLQKRSQKQVRDHNQKIAAAKGELKEMQPAYERAKEVFREKEQKQKREARLQRSVAGRDCACEYKKKLEKYYMEKPNTKKADWRATKDLAKEGFSKDQLKAALKKESFVEPDLSEKEFDKYVDRTVEKAMKEPDVIEKRQEKDKSLEHSRGFGMDRGRGR